MAIVDDSLVFARPIPNGFTFTLASRLGQMLQLLEDEIGPRDKSYTVLGVEFRDGLPQLWFPGNCGNVVIQLSREAMQEPIRAMFQLAHECVHLLDPHPGGTNVLEEGTATRFAQQYITQLGHAMSTGDKRYDRARQLVETLVATRADALKELRRLHGPLRNITADQFRRVSPGLDDDLIEHLCEKF